MAELRTESGGMAGFTLMELMIVIVIFGMIQLMLFGGVRFAGRAWDMQERRIDRQGDFSAVQTVLRQMILSGHGFDGDGGALRLVGSLPKSLKRGGLFDIEIKTDTDRLVLTWKPHLRGDAPQVDPAEADLIKEIAAFDVAYYQPPTKDGGGWQPTWQDKSKLPPMIRLSLQMTDGRRWPPFRSEERRVGKEC